MTDEKILETLLQHGTPVAFKKNKHLLRQGEICKKIYLLREGVVQHYIFDVRKNQKTLRLSREGDFFYTSIVSHYTGEPSYINCKTLTDVHLLYWEKEAFNDLINSSEALKEFRYRKLQEFILQKQKKEFMMLTQDAQQRLTSFQQEYGELFNRIPSKVIASFLNMEPETLSRLKKNQIS